MYSYEFHNFTIVQFYGDWLVYGMNELLGKFDTDKEAEDFVLEILNFFSY